MLDGLLLGRSAQADDLISQERAKPFLMPVLPGNVNFADLILTTEPEVHPWIIGGTVAEAIRTDRVTIRSPRVNVTRAWWAMPPSASSTRNMIQCSCGAMLWSTQGR